MLAPVSARSELHSHRRGAVRGPVGLMYSTRLAKQFPDDINKLQVGIIVSNANNNNYISLVPARYWMPLESYDILQSTFFTYLIMFYIRFVSYTRY